MKISEEQVEYWVQNSLIKRFEFIIHASPFIKNYLAKIDDENFYLIYIKAFAINVSLVYARHYEQKIYSEPFSNYLETLNNKDLQPFYKLLEANNWLDEFYKILKEYAPIWIDQYNKDNLNSAKQQMEEGKRNLIERSKTVFENYENQLFIDIYGHSEFKEFLKRNKIKDINGAIITIIHKYLHEIYKGTKNPKFITLLNVCDEETIEYRQRFLEEIMNNQKAKDDFSRTFVYMIKQLNKWYKIKRK